MAYLNPHRHWVNSVLRVVFLGMSVGLHGLALAALLPRPVDENAPIEGLELSLAPPEGEALVEERDLVDSSAQNESVAATPKVEPLPPPETPVILEAAKVEVEEAPVMEAAVKEPPPEFKPIPETPPETPPELPKEETQVQANTQQTAAAEETFAHRAVGVENGVRSGGGVTQAAYAAAVKKEIAKNKRRPNGEQRGSVSLSFIIGPNGRAERIDIVKSVDPTLDEAARKIVAAVQLPPPPGGMFPATISIKFE